MPVYGRFGYAIFGDGQLAYLEPALVEVVACMTGALLNEALHTAARATPALDGFRARSGPCSAVKVAAMATALITGGTSGIGAAFARALAARGDNLVLVARNAERLTAMAIEITDRYAVHVETISADLSSRDDALRIADRLSSAERPIDLLINNAGFGVPVSLLASDTAPHEHAADVMIRAVLLLGAAAGRTMKARGSGAIVNVASTVAFVTMGSYSAIKAWVMNYSEGLANELAGSGVTVTALCPGWVRTEFHERADIKTSKIPGVLWLDADRLVADALGDIARGQVISIPSKRYQILIFILRHLPRRAVRAVSAKISSSRH